MSNFLKLTSQIENQLGQFATRLLRIEAHVRQGDLRAATHRLDGFFQELDEFEDDIEFPIELVVVGSQLGFLSGGGSWIRGRIPAALVGGAAGWLFGQSAAHEYRETIQELKLRAQALALQLEEAAASAEAAPSAGGTDQHTSEPDEQTGGSPAE
jgi:hypothetical protein